MAPGRASHLLTPEIVPVNIGWNAVFGKARESGAMV